MLGPESFALGAAAHQAYFDYHLGDILNESFTLFATQTGRLYSPLSTNRLQDAQQVLIVQRSAIETAQAVVDYVRKAQKTKLGVLGVHCLRPCPEQQIAQWVKQKRVVAVLERTDTSLATEPPLMREVRASIDRALETARFGAQGRDSYPAIRESERPRLRTISYGLGGLSLRSADLIALCGKLNETAHPRIFLGVNFTQESGSYPKRQVVLDALCRSYPDIAGLGWRSAEPPVDLRPEGAFTVAVHRVAGQVGQGLAVEAASFMWQLMRGALRSRPALFWGQWASYGVDRVTLAPETMRDPGDDVLVDLAVLAGPLRPAMKPWSALRDGGAILVESDLSDEALWKTLPIELQSDMGERQLSLFRLSTPQVATPSTLKSPELATQQEVLSNQHDVQVAAETLLSGQPAPQSARERLLGAMLRVLLDHDLLDVKAQRVVSARERALTNVPEVQRKSLLEAFNKGFDGVHAVAQATSVGVPQQDASSGHDEAPMAVRHLGHIDDPYGNLPQFWDHIGALYRNRDVDWLTADPLMATASVPPLSSTFRHMNDSRKMLPAFEPALCAGCGECWTRCPDSAIGAIAIRPDGLINTGIRLAGADPLRPIAAKLAARLSGLTKPTDAVPTFVGDLIGDAASSLLDKLSWPEDRKRAVQRASEDLIDTIGSLQTASTDAFFNSLENEA